MTNVMIPALLGAAEQGGVAGVSSFEGRTGDVTIQTGDATSSEITNVSVVTGATVTAALDKLSADLAGVAAGISDWQASVKSVTDTPPGTPAAGDRYLIGASPTGAWASNAKHIAQWNGSAWTFAAPAAGMATIAEDTVRLWAYRASDTTWVDLGGFTAPVVTVFGRQGAVVAASGDYTAAQVTLTPTGTVAANTVQGGIAELASEKAQASVSVIAGDGLVGGGDLSGNRTLNVGAGTGIAVTADAVSLAEMTEGTIKGRAAATGTGDPVDLTATQVRTILNVADGSTAAGAAGDAYATSHEADTTAHTAANIVNVAAGSIAATTVQAAINELDTEKQPLDATLTALAGVTVAANKMIYATGADAFATTDLTAAARALLDDADATAMLATLGAATAGHSHNGLVPAGGTTGQVLGKVSGTDYATAWQNAGGAGAQTQIEAGTLSYTVTGTTYTTLRTIPLDAAAVYDAVGTQATTEVTGAFSQSSTTACAARFELSVGGTVVATAQTANSTTTASKNYQLTWETWRTATGIGGRWQILASGIAIAAGACTERTIAISGSIALQIRASTSAANGTVTATYYSVDRVGTIAGGGASQRSATTMSALRAIDPVGSPALVNGELCYLQGFTTAGDGGEGYFAWSSTSAAAEDYGVTIVPDTAPANGRWLRQTGGQPYRAEWFGARGDGVTDDDIPLQRALTAVGAVKGTLYITDGRTFRTTSVITVPNDVSIVSNGHGTLDVAVSYLSLGLRNTVRGVRFAATGKVNGQCLYAEYATPTDIAFTLDQCYFHNVQCAMVNLTRCRNVAITNNRYVGDPAANGATGWSYHGLFLWACQDVLISGNHITNALHLIEIHGLTNSRIVNNHLDSGGLQGISFTTDLAGFSAVADQVAYGLNANNTISGNLISGCREEGVAFDTVMATAARSGQNKTICSDLVHSVADPDGALDNRIQINLTATNAGATTGWADGYYVGFLNGRLEGYCAPIIASGKDGSDRPYIQIAKIGGGVTDTGGTAIANTDRVFIFVGHVGNVISNNVIQGDNTGSQEGYQQTGVGLWGCCWRNTVANNVVDVGAAAVSINGMVGPADNVAAVGPCGGNIVDGNQASLGWDTSANTLDDGTPPQLLAGFSAIMIGGAGNINYSSYSSATEVWPNVVGTAVLNNIVNHVGVAAIGVEWTRGTIIDGNHVKGDPKGAIKLVESMGAIVGRNYGAGNNLVTDDDLVLSYVFTLPSWSWAYQLEQPAFGVNLDRSHQRVEDFEGKFDTATSTAPNGWIIGASNGGSITSEDCWWNDGSVGVIAMRTGGSASGSAYLAWHKPHLRLDRDGSRMVFDAVVYLQSASSAEQRFTTWIGAVNSASDAAPTVGCWFDYTDNVNGGKWRAVCGAASLTAVDTGVTPAVSAFPAVWTRLTITQEGSAVKFLINGVLVATITTNVPLSSYTQALAPFARIVKSVGTTESTLFLDLMRWGQDFTRGRYGDTAGRMRNIAQYWS